MKLRCTFPLLALAATASSAQIVSPNTNLNAREEQIITAAQPGTAPRFNGPQIISVRPNTPLLCALNVTGERPITFSVRSLPRGLQLDPVTGILTGSLPNAGEFQLKVTAQSSAGKATTSIKLVCGNTIALTPPMGWNSYDAFGDSVKESEVLANAQWLKDNLQPFGWDT